MQAQSFYEILGYVASVLVAVSLMMSSILRLRLINLVGSLAFTVYGLAIHAYPVAAVNGLIVLINLYYLYRMLGTKEFFRLLRVEPGSEYLRFFLAYHAAEIGRFLPDFAHTPADGQLTLFVLRDMMPAGLFIGEQDGSRLCVTLDFVIPQYRDFKIGRYLFREQAAFFRERGISEIVSDPGNAQHEAYLRKMGFVPSDPSNRAAAYRLAIG
ncbi:MAG: hypothetical protein JWM27_3546 [Gemmatimonadetes bacterium]|nr:hypothetical protein [Gemmatimonadota bacterium]